MTAETAAREHLELLIRRIAGPGDTKRIMQAADAYAYTVALAEIDHATGAMRLQAATAEYFEKREAAA
jgi:CMP-2-keto-3-deoxyoctulosonic acid synthetase